MGATHDLQITRIVATGFSCLQAVKNGSAITASPTQLGQKTPKPMPVFGPVIGYLLVEILCIPADLYPAPMQPMTPELQTKYLFTFPYGYSLAQFVRNFTITYKIAQIAGGRAPPIPPLLGDEYPARPIFPGALAGWWRSGRSSGLARRCRR